MSVPVKDKWFVYYSTHATLDDQIAIERKGLQPKLVIIESARLSRSECYRDVVTGDPIKSLEIILREYEFAPDYFTFETYDVLLMSKFMESFEVERLEELEGKKTFAYLTKEWIPALAQPQK